MEETQNNSLKKVKEYLPIIILIPTIIGGTFQLVQLFLISPSFIRLYSVTQAFTDGIFSLFFILTVSLVIWLALYLKPKYKYFTYVALEEIPFKIIKIPIQYFFVFMAHTIFACLILLFFFSFIDMGMDFYEILQGVLSMAILIAIVTATITLIVIKKKIKNRSSTQIKKKLIDDVKVSKFIATYSIIVFVLLAMVNYANSSFSDTLNNENLFCFLDTVYFENPVQHYQLLYFNDKFVFVEVFFEDENITSQNIAVKFETLFDFKICKNIESGN